MIYKRHIENVAKASSGDTGGNGADLEEQVHSPLSLLASLDELDQVRSVDTKNLPIKLFLVINKPTLNLPS